MFKFENMLSDGNFLVIDTAIPTDKTINFINQNNIENIYINRSLGYNLLNIKPFSNLSGIKKLIVVGGEMNLQGIERFKGLEFLQCSCDITTEIDLSKFENLKELRITWFKQLKKLESLKKLEVLSLRNFKGSVEIIQELTSLQKLELPQSYVLKDLDFVKPLLKLKYFLISYGKVLQDISGLIDLSNTLEVLEITNCKKIKYEGLFLKMKNLCKIMLTSSADLPNLSFISSLENLKFFSFVNTNVIDGDLTMLEGLEYVGFLNKRHYTHKKVDGKLVKK